MNLSLKILSFLLVFAANASASDYEELSWYDLMPADWTPYAEEEDIFARHDESAPAMPFIQQEAPVVPALNKKKIRLPGYVIPIVYKDDAVSEFLLVPYIGACIHVPPPPSNQMIYVTLKDPLISTSLWAPVWVNGELKLESAETEYARTSYRMDGASSELYEY